MTDIPYLDRLRDDLVTGIGRTQQRVASRRRRVALLLTPIVLAGAALATFLPGGSSPALAIEPQGDWIEVRIADIAASEAEMESELRAAGIDADVSLTPTTAEHVGRWTCVAHWTSFVPSPEDSGPPQPPRDTRRLTPEAVSIKRGITERLVVVAGREPEPGEEPNPHPELCGGMRLVR